MLKARRLALVLLLLGLCGGAIFAMLTEVNAPLNTAEPSVSELGISQAPQDPVRAIAMAPSGDEIAYIEERVDGASLWLLHDGARMSRRLLRRTDADNVEWSRDGRWLFLVSRSKLVALTRNEEEGSGIITQLGHATSKRFLRVDSSQNAAALIAEDHNTTEPGQSRSFSLARYTPGGKRELLWSGNKKPSDAVIAPDGTLFMRLVGMNDIGVWRVRPRQQDSIFYSCRALERCSLIAAGQDGGVILATSAGHNLDGMVALDSNGKIIRTITDPAGVSDVSSILVDPITQAPLLASFPFAGGNLAAAHPISYSLIAAVNGIANRPVEVRLQSASSGRWLVGLRTKGSPALRWHRFRSGIEHLTALEGLPTATEAAFDPPQRVVKSYRASDGMRIFAYVTRPAWSAKGPLPLVVLVHGGPWSMSPVGFNPVASELARRGYLVVEPQFRASRGYGRAHLLAAGSDFGQGAVLRDIRDSADWMIATADADPQRTVIMGASFGGYAALLATTLWPEIFKAAIALVPPSDFAWNLSYAAANPDQGEIGISQIASLQALGADPYDASAMARLSAQSPSANVSSLRRPIMILAGGSDRQVPIRSVNHYVTQLCRESKNVTYYVAPSAGHSPIDARQRDEVLALVTTFLEKVNGAAEGVGHEPQSQPSSRLLAKPCVSHKHQMPHRPKNKVEGNL